MPFTFKQRLLDLLAIGRVSNLPTVWSNVLVGILAGYALHQYSQAGLPPLEQIAYHLLALLGATGAYLFGTFLNDWKDVPFDREHRPERPIPAGRFRRRTILLVALGFAIGSNLCFWCFSFRTFVVGLLLTALIILYTWFHKRTPLAIVPMGLCRMLLYVIGFVTMAEGPLLMLITTRGGPWTQVFGQLFYEPLVRSGLEVIVMGLGLAAYVAGLTLVARYESRPDGHRYPRAFLWFLLFIPLITHLWWTTLRLPLPPYDWSPAVIGILAAIPFVAWTIFALRNLGNSIPVFVSRTLAGICLLDLVAVAAITTAHPGSLIGGPGPFFLTPPDYPFEVFIQQPLLLALFPLALFALALGLQKIAPAT
ncbi:MAG: UbiA family prenyltransferase [Akkermansiaceae bacterium]|nr:UbiA family prenyltransferase [Akkermansiaceae bacterium]